MNHTTTHNELHASTIRFPRRVVILGNDVTAWMAAAMLSHQFLRLGIRITVCSDRPGPSDFVLSSSTSTALGGLLKNLGVDEHDMLRACQGTYKLATLFSDWACEGRDFWLPFGMESQRIEGQSLFDAWFAERKAGRLLRPLHSYSAHWSASLAGKSPHSFSATSEFAESGQYGFHLDTRELAEWFRTVALDSGAEEVQGGIQRVDSNGRGGIAQVINEHDQAVPGDLFLDCRTSDANDQKSTSENWLSWEEYFPCNRIVSLRRTSGQQVPVFTRSVGLDCGWSRSIPLASETETTYVFCSSLESDTEARRRLQTVVQNGSTPIDDSTMSAAIHTIGHGRRKVFWKDNVVHLGNAACQLDPVASVDLHLHQAGIELLMEHFPDRRVGKATRAEFNSRMSSITEEFREMAQLHYVLMRAWPRFCQHTGSEAAVDQPVVRASEELQRLLDIYDASGIVQVRNSESIPAEGVRSLLAGCGRYPERPSVEVQPTNVNQIQDALRRKVKSNEAVIKDLPLHEELLAWIHTGPFQQVAG